MATYFEPPAEPCKVEALHFAAARHAERTEEWWRPRHRAAKRVLPVTARREALAALEKERTRLQGAGELFGSASAVITHYVRAEMDRKGWLARSWRVVKNDEARLRGRRWGVPNNPMKDWTARLRVYLPDDLAEQLRRATWWTSAPATRELLRLRVLDPSGVDPRLDKRRAKALADIVTTGDVLRAALDAAVEPWFPRTAPQDSQLAAVIDRLTWDDRQITKGSPDHTRLIDNARGEAGTVPRAP